MIVVSKAAGSKFVNLRDIEGEEKASVMAAISKNIENEGSRPVKVLLDIFQHDLHLVPPRKPERKGDMEILIFVPIPGNIVNVVA